MILSEFKKQVDFLCDNGHGDNLVLVTLSESSIGSRTATGINRNSFRIRLGAWAGEDIYREEKHFLWKR